VLGYSYTTETFGTNGTVVLRWTGKRSLVSNLNVGWFTALRTDWTAVDSTVSLGSDGSVSVTAVITLDSVQHWSIAQRPYTPTSTTTSTSTTSTGTSSPTTTHHPIATTTSSSTTTSADITGTTQSDGRIPITDTWSVTQSQLNHFIASLQNMTNDTKMYNWSRWDVGMRWDKQGMVDQSEIDQYIQQGSVGGGGIYLASTITGSAGHGVWLTVFTLPKGTPIYDSSKAHQAFGRLISDRDKAMLGRIVPFVDMYNSTDRVIHSSTLTRGLIAGVRAPYPDNSSWPILTEENEIADALTRLQRMNDTIPNWILHCSRAERMIHAAEYFGMVHLHRAMRTDPSRDIWQTVKPEERARFERFVAIKRGHWARAVDDHSMQTSFLGTWGWGSRERWLDQMINDTIPLLWRDLTGGSGSMFREEGNVLFSGRWTVVSPSVLAVMQANRYLHIELTNGTRSKGSVAIRAHSPDVQHYEQVVEYLSPQLVRALRTDGVKAINDTKLRGDLNSRLMEELLLHILDSIYENSTTAPTNDANFLTDFVSLAPLKNSSTLVARLIKWMSMSQRAYAEYIPELVPMTYPNSMNEIALRRIDNRDYLELYGQIIRQLMMSHVLRRPPQYSALPFWTTQATYYNRVLGFPNNFTADESNNWKLVGSGQWTELFNKLAGNTSWSLPGSRWDKVYAIARTDSYVNNVTLTLSGPLLTQKSQFTSLLSPTMELSSIDPIRSTITATSNPFYVVERVGDTAGVEFSGQNMGGIPIAIQVVLSTGLHLGREINWTVTPQSGLGLTATGPSQLHAFIVNRDTQLDGTGNYLGAVAAVDYNSSIRYMFNNLRDKSEVLLGHINPNDFKAGDVTAKDNSAFSAGPFFPVHFGSRFQFQAGLQYRLGDHLQVVAQTDCTLNINPLSSSIMAVTPSGRLPFAYSLQSYNDSASVLMRWTGDASLLKQSPANSSWFVFTIEDPSWRKQESTNIDMGDGKVALITRLHLNSMHQRWIIAEGSSTTVPDTSRPTAAPASTVTTAPTSRPKTSPTTIGQGERNARMTAAALLFAAMLFCVLQ